MLRELCVGLVGLGFGASALVGCAAAPVEEDAVAVDDGESAFTGGGTLTDVGTLEELCSPDASGGEWAKWSCSGVDGYGLVVRDGYARERIAVRSQTGEHDLDLGNHIIGAGRFGPKAEWVRTSMPGELALVMRYIQPTDENPRNSSLIVAKVTPKASCVFTVIERGNGAHAREAIASAAFRDHACSPTRPTPLVPEECGTLRANTGIGVDQAVTSCGGAYALVMQNDGNLVMYRTVDAAALWSTKTAGSRATRAWLSRDGSFATYDESWNPEPVWSARTTGPTDAVLRVQDDGNLVIYDARNRAIWATRTQQ